MIQIYPLYRLQQVDSRIASFERQLAADDGRAEIEKKIRVRDRKVQEAEKQHHALRARQKETELKLGSIESHVKDIEKKLYSGSTTHSKELAGYNQELEILKGQKSVLEDEVLGLMEQVEAAAAEIATIKTRLERARKELDEHAQKAGASRHEIEVQLEDVRKKRADAAAEIEASLLSRYEKLRQRKEGVAVAKIENKACGECGAEVVDQVKRRVQERQLETCAYCERILFVD